MLVYILGVRETQPPVLDTRGRDGDVQRYVLMMILPLDNDHTEGAIERGGGGEGGFVVRWITETSFTVMFT